jgi:metal-dependent amidase/aminoacylase/carboxypeptidase family protein
MPPVMGGEDFAHYLERIPGCFFFLGCGEVQTNGRGYLHNAAFNLDENCLPVGMTALAALALSYGCSKNT